MLRGLLTKVIGDSDKREVARLQKVVERINALEPEFESLDDAQLKARTTDFRQRSSSRKSIISSTASRCWTSSRCALPK